MHRSNSQRANSQRPYSLNNPFRNASVDSSINQYETDTDFQNWVSQNTKPMPYATGRRNDSSLSFTDSINETPEEEDHNTEDYFIDLNTTKDVPRTSREAINRNKYV